MKKLAARLNAIAAKVEMTGGFDAPDTPLSDYISPGAEKFSNDVAKGIKKYAGKRASKIKTGAWWVHYKGAKSDDVTPLELSFYVTFDKGGQYGLGAVRMEVHDHMTRQKEKNTYVIGRFSPQDIVDVFKHHFVVEGDE